MALKRKDGESSTENKKRKSVCFAKIDSGIEANECIKVFLVSSQEEVGGMSSFCMDPVDLNQFFGEDGKIYGYKDLKINIWMSSISFHAYADTTFQSTTDGGKGITDLRSCLQKIFGESLLEKKEFLQTFSTESSYIETVISKGATIHCDTLDGHDAEGSAVEVIRMDLNSMPVGLLYSRLVPLALLLVEGSSPVDITDPRWEIYLTVKKIPDQLGDISCRLLGFMTVYRFYHYPDSIRLRISQILVLPPCQGQGHGRRLLESVNLIAMSENVYDITVEEPSDYLQYLRACIDTSRLLTFEPTKRATSKVVSYLKEGNLSKRSSKSHSEVPSSVLEAVREKFKINKKQFFRCWEVLVYLNLDTKNNRCMENFRALVGDRVKVDILDKDGGDTTGKRLVEVPNDYDHEMTFVVCRLLGGSDPEGLDGNVEEDKKSQEEQLNQLVDERMAEIAEIAEKVILLSKSCESSAHSS